jgi:tetratricopeptide (TPR) repeat protein
MQERRFADAAAAYAVLAKHDDSPALRFNRSWSLAMIGQKDAALALLDEANTMIIPAAAMLRVQLLHERGEFDAAADFARSMLDLHGDDEGFAAAVSVLAIDIEDEELARRCADKGGNHPDALASRAALSLGDGHVEAAFANFDAALAIRQHHPRAWIGRGLARLARHDSAAAASDIDRGAEQFGDHIGSWIAAGWAHFTAGDHATARARFDHALMIDDSFGETHGSLAVLDVLAGDIESAKRRTAIARRLDRESFSAMLAQTLLTQDDPTAAQAIVERAMATPINDKGQTLAHFLAGFSPPTVH